MEKTTKNADAELLAQNREIVSAVQGLLGDFDNLDEAITKYLRDFVRNTWKIKDFGSAKALAGSLIEAASHVKKPGLTKAVLKWLYRMGISQSKAGIIRIKKPQQDWGENAREKFIMGTGTVFSLIERKAAYEDFDFPENKGDAIAKIALETGIEKAERILRKARNGENAETNRVLLTVWESAIAEVKRRFPEAAAYKKAKEAKKVA